ncbi:GIY-YIG nuclease family protein [Thalassotalea sp. HSM 43]|uniref:GIY-YIG nuclease family protein n=1 Tax=Thalassotalea sp. HSM 43 TaxID=2552945 RepID=UPI001081CBBA|nr:GIY-YIG nuclease family protein [Thalassotalea sp. HSM 43]QBY03982.1 GIY-YIG nuclease family protein [Thalassotalea sp. HSM 43]
MKRPVIYILSNERNTVLYIGVTSNLIQRVYQHKHKTIRGFSAKYNLTKLVYFETFDDMDNAITREKRLKQWHRRWKERLIGEMNPDWRDLYFDII